VRLEDRPGIAHEHLLDLVLADASLAQRRQDVVGDVIVVPVGPGPALGVLREQSVQQLASCERTILPA